MKLFIVFRKPLRNVPQIIENICAHRRYLCAQGFGADSLLHPAYMYSPTEIAVLAFCLGHPAQTVQLMAIIEEMRSQDIQEISDLYNYVWKNYCEGKELAHLPEELQCEIIEQWLAHPLKLSWEKRTFGIPLSQAKTIGIVERPYWIYVGVEGPFKNKDALIQHIQMCYGLPKPSRVYEVTKEENAKYNPGEYFNLAAYEKIFENKQEPIPDMWEYSCSKGIAKLQLYANKVVTERYFMGYVHKNNEDYVKGHFEKTHDSALSACEEAFAKAPEIKKGARS